MQNCIVYKTFIRYSKVHNRKKCLTLFFLHRYHSNNAATKPSEFNQFKAYFLFFCHQIGFLNRGKDAISNCTK